MWQKSQTLIRCNDVPLAASRAALLVVHLVAAMAAWSDASKAPPRAGKMAGKTAALRAEPRADRRAASSAETKVAPTAGRTAGLLVAHSAVRSVGQLVASRAVSLADPSVAVWVACSVASV